ncbi:MAG: lytic transglycosylase domain-containing protein [Rhizomicrobium sp.]
MRRFGTDGIRVSRVAGVMLLATLAAGSSAPIGTDGGTQRTARRAAPQHRLALRSTPALARKLSATPAPAAAPSAFARETAMRPAALMARWTPEIREASRRFAVPELWIRAVMTIESGGRTMMGENKPIRSDAGAMGLMQVMPETWAKMRRRYGLGTDPNAPHDNIMAGAAYLHELDQVYGYPGLFAAYNDGPGMLEAHRRLQQMMPAETTAYVWNIASILSTGERLPARTVRDAATLQTDAPPAGTAPVAARVVVMRQRKPTDGYDDEYDER